MPRFARCILLLILVTFAALSGGQTLNSTVESERPRTALLVVDAQVGVLGSAWDATRVTKNIEVLVAKARAQGVPVFWIQHEDDELKFGSEPWKLVANFVPTAKEAVIRKKYNSSFGNTDLDRQLKELKIARIVLAGASTNWCIRATAYAALDRGYHLALVADAHSTEAMKLETGQVIPAASIVSELNTVMQWISVPNVKTDVKPTAAVTF